MSSKDYDDVYLCVSDYDVRCSFKRPEKLQTLFSFMYDKFGDDWANKAIKYLTGKKASRSVQYIKELVSTKKTNLENNILEK